jgi:PAS domain S-box-containing protein
VNGKLLIVEDELIVALDLQLEVEKLGFEVVGIAESAEEAIAAAEVHRPDLVLMDIRIEGSMDGIQTARFLRAAFQIPVVFLTAYADEATINRASLVLPYGYLNKPFRTGELQATVRVAMHKAQEDRAREAEIRCMAETVAGMREGLFMVGADGGVQFMNEAASILTGVARESARGRNWRQVLVLSLDDQRSSLLGNPEAVGESKMEGFGVKATRGDGTPFLTDLSFAPLADFEGRPAGFVITFRDATERVTMQAMKETTGEKHCFDQSTTVMAQLDSDGCIVRVNKALLDQSGVAEGSLLGRTLTGLSLDPDPRIAKDLMQLRLQSNTFMGTAQIANVN